MNRLHDLHIVVVTQGEVVEVASIRCLRFDVAKLEFVDCKMPGMWGIGICSRTKVAERSWSSLSPAVRSS